MRFEIGDVVVLKSGGPAMTINNYTNKEYLCVWFVGADLFETYFKEEVLDFYKENK